MSNRNRGEMQASRPVESRHNAAVFLFWFASAVVAVVGAFPVVSDWMQQAKDTSALLLLNSSLIVLLVAFGAFAACRDWDWVMRLDRSKWVWVAVGIGLVTLLAASFLSLSKLIPVGLFFLLGSFFASQKSRADGRWLFRFAFLILPFVAWPSTWESRCLQEAANVVASGVAGTLTWLRVPVSVVESSLLLESHTVELLTLPLATTLQVVMLMIILWVAVKRRSILALPVYMLSGLLWFLGIVAALGFWIAWFPEPSDAELVLCTAVGYMLAGSMILSTDRALRVLLFEIPSEMEGRQTNPLVVAWNHCFHSMTYREASETAGSL